MNDQSKCFILTPAGYEEITYAELTRRQQDDPSYHSRRFIPLHGMLLEVEAGDYRIFYREIERQKYLRKEATRVKEMSCDNLGAIPSVTPTVEDDVTHRQLLEALRRGLKMLPDDDRALITALFYEGKSEREVAKETGVPQKTVNDRRHKALAKLKKFMKA